MLKIGQKFFTGIGTYEIQKHLGQGKTAEVYEGVHTRSSDRVAIKIAREEMAEQVRQNFEREEEVLQKLEATEPDSGYFPRVFLRSEKGKQPYLILSLVTAEPLRNIALRYDNRLSGSLEREQLAIQAAISYAKMLTILHRAGFAATDRKLDDVLWTGEQVVVLDWNAIGSGEIGQRNDLYQFGVFWHQLLLGSVPPRDGQSLSQHRWWDSLTYGTQQVLNQALHPQLEARFQSAQHLQDILSEQYTRLTTPLMELIRQGDSLYQEGDACSKSEKKEEKERADALFRQVYALLEVAIKHYPDHPSTSEVRSLHRELRQKVLGTGQDLTKQGIDNLKRGHIDFAGENFQQALKAIGTNAYLQLHIHRWQVLAAVLKNELDLEIRNEACETIAALNEARWEVVSRGFANWKKLKPDLPFTGTTENEAIFLYRDFQLCYQIAQAQEDIPQRRYAQAGEKYQDAYQLWRTLPPDYRLKLERVGYNRLDKRAMACHELADREVRAYVLLQEAVQALDANNIQQAQMLWDSGYQIIMSQAVVNARAQLHDTALPPTLEAEFLATWLRLVLRQQAADVSDFSVRVEKLRALLKEFPQDAWANAQLLAVRDELLSELKYPLALINTNDSSSFAPAQSVRWAYELFKDDGEVQEALQQYRDRIQLAVAEYMQHITRLLEMPPTLRLLQEARRFVVRAQEILQRIRPLSPLLFPVDWLQSQSDQLAAWQRRQDQHQEQLDMLIGEGVSLGLEYGHQDASLSDGGGDAELLAELDEFLKQEREKAQQFLADLFVAYRQKAQTAKEEHQFTLSRFYWQKIIDNAAFSSRDRSTAERELSGLNEYEKNYREVENRLTELWRQVTAVNIATPEPDTQVNRLQGIVAELPMPKFQGFHPAGLQKYVEKTILAINTYRARQALATLQQTVDARPLIPNDVEREVGILEDVIYQGNRIPDQELLGDEIKQFINEVRMRIEGMRRQAAQAELARIMTIMDTLPPEPQDPGAEIGDLRLAIDRAQRITHEQFASDIARFVQSAEARIKTIGDYVEQRKAEERRLEAKGQLDKVYEIENALPDIPAKPDEEINQLRQAINQAQRITHEQFRLDVDQFINRADERIQRIQQYVKEQELNAHYQQTREQLQKIYDIERALPDIPQNPDGEISQLAQAISLAQRITATEFTPEIERFVNHAQRRIERIQQYKATQREEADENLLAEISDQLHKDDPDLSRNFMGETEKLRGFALSVQQITGRHPSLQPVALPIQEAISQKLAELRMWQSRRQLDEIAQAISEIRQEGQEEPAAARLQEINKRLDRLVQEDEKNAGDEAKILKVRAEEAFKGVAWQARLNQLQMVKNQAVAWPLLGNFAQITDALSQCRSLQEQCQAIADKVPAFPEINKRTADYHDELAQQIQSHWQKQLHWLTAQVNQPFHEQEDRVCREKLAQARSLLQQIPLTDAQRTSGSERLTQLEDQCWRRETLFWQNEAATAQTGDTVDWEKVFGFLEKARQSRERLSIEAQKLLPAPPDERWLEAAQTAVAAHQFANALQWAYLARRYYENQPGSPRSQERLEQARQIEVQALAGLHGDERQKELAQEWLTKAQESWQQQPQGADLPTTNAIYHQALDYFGWAVTFDPNILVSEESLGRKWQERQERRARARALVSRCHAQPTPPLKERFVWAREAQAQAPELPDVAINYQQARDDVMTAVAQVREGIGKAEANLQAGQYPMAEAALTAIQPVLHSLPDPNELKEQDFAQDVARVEILRRQITAVQQLSNAIQQTQSAQNISAEQLGHVVKTYQQVDPDLPKPLPAPLQDLVQTLRQSVNQANHSFKKPPLWQRPFKRSKSETEIKMELLVSLLNQLELP